MISKKNFKIGDSVVCTKAEGFYEDRICVGHVYLIEDIDVHFPGKIVVKLDSKYYQHSEFVPGEIFDDISVIRDFKIDKILK